MAAGLRQVGEHGLLGLYTTISKALGFAVDSGIFQARRQVLRATVGKRLAEAWCAAHWVFSQLSCKDLSREGSLHLWSPSTTQRHVPTVVCQRVSL